MRSLVLSDWEVDELVYYRSRGWTFEEIASQYGITARTAERIYKREEGRSRKDAPRVISEVCYVKSFEEELQVLVDYGHDCCARIDDKIHECALRIREAHEREVGSWMDDEPQRLVTYDVLGNERHEAVCNLREWKPDSAIDADKQGEVQIRLLYQLLGLGGAMMMDGADAAVAVRDCLIYLLGGNEPKLGDLYGIWKGDGDGVDAGGRDAACHDTAVHAAIGHMADSGCGHGPAGVAPITTELRGSMRTYTKSSIDDGKEHVELDTETFARLCDAIDAVHAQLERDCEMWRDGAEDMRMERDDALKEHHEWAPESHYMMLPKDANGVPIHIGDVVEWPDTSTAEVVGVYENGFFYVEGEDDIAAEWTSAHNKVHHESETVEDVLREFGKAWVEWEDGSPYDPIAKYAARLRLEGDAE